MDWDKLKIFHAVAEAGSFTNATVNLNLSQSAISRQIQSLEQDLKVQLFERHARGLVLTENGDYLFKSAHEIISKLKDVETNLSGHKDKLNGKLIVTTAEDIHYEPYDFAVSHLTMMFLAKDERKKVIERLKENRKEGGALVFLEKIIPSGGYFSTVSMRMTLSEKLNAGASCEEIIKKELSLAGIQVPLSEEELEGATKWFCFGDFAGFIYSE